MNYRYKCRCAPPRKLLVVHHRTPPPLTFDQFQVLDQFDIFDQFVFDQFDVLDHTRAKQPLRPTPLPRRRAPGPASGRAAGTFSLSYGGKREGGGGMTL